MEARKELCLPVQRMTDMLPQGHCLSIMGWGETSAMRLSNVPAACWSFRSGEALVGALVCGEAQPQAHALQHLVTFQRGRVPPTAAATRVGITIDLHKTYDTHSACGQMNPLHLLNSNAVSLPAHLRAELVC